MTVEHKDGAAAGQPGAVYGSYRVVSELGRGGMGVVYLAEHAIMGKQVAVKVLLPEFSGREDLVSRFFNEARAAARLDHPAFIEVFDCGIAGGNAFMVMEFVAGESLASYLAREGRLSVSRAVMLTRVIAEAMSVAHDNGIIHRDLKPDNIMLTAATKASRVGPSPVKILDFGIAKLSAAASKNTPVTRTGTLMGTPLYMSPEQCKGSGGIDARTDIYSLGCILYALITGTPPFVRAGDGEIIVAHIIDPVIPMAQHGITIPPELDAVVMKLLAKDPADRFQSMAELVAHLESIGAGVQPSGRTSPPKPTPIGRTAVTSATRTGSRTGPPPVVVEGSTTFSRSTGEVAVADQPERLPTRRPVLWVGLAALLVVGGGAAFVATRSGSSARTATNPAPAVLPEKPAPAVVPPETPPAPPPAKPAAPAKVVIKLNSEPSGARVTNATDKSVLGTTPLEKSFERGGAALDLVIEKRGFRRETLKIDLGSDYAKTVLLQQRRARPAAVDPDESRKL